ncbi:MAG TPA: RING finger protein [Patescibacteria group bacterium]|nr:RING finger protein [Patescibacteria group bacterium]
MKFIEGKAGDACQVSNIYPNSEDCGSNMGWMEITMRVSRDEIIAYFFELKKNNPNITIDEVKALILERYQAETPAVEPQLALPKRCVKCGAYNQESAVYCSGCGNKMPKAMEHVHGHYWEKSGEVPLESKDIGVLRDGVMVCKCCGQPLPPADAAAAGADVVEALTPLPPRRQSYVGVICSYCEKRIEFRQNVLVCPECGDPQHVECWRANQCRCSVPNCPGEVMLDPLPPIAETVPETQPHKKFPFNFLPSLNIWEKEPEKEYEAEDFFRQDVEEPQRRSRKKKWILILLVALLLAACAGLGWLATQKHSPDLGMTPTEFKLRYNREESTIVKALNGVSVLKMSRIVLQEHGAYKVFILSNERHALIGVVNDDGKLRAVLTGGRYFTQNDRFFLARLWHAAIGVFSQDPIVSASGMLNLEEVTRRTLLPPTMMEMEENDSHVPLKPVNLLNAKCAWVTTQPNDQCYMVICNTEDSIEALSRELLDTDILLSNRQTQPADTH